MWARLSRATLSGNPNKSSFLQKTLRLLCDNLLSARKPAGSKRRLAFYYSSVYYPRPVPFSRAPVRNNLVDTDENTAWSDEQPAT